MEKHIYQAEETGEGSTSTGGVLDEAKLTEMIRKSQEDSVKAALAQLKQEQENTDTSQTQVQVEQPQRDIWDDILEPKLVKSQQLAQQAGFAAAAAADKVDFYEGDFWTETVDDWLSGESPEEIKTERKELRQKIEKQFEKLAKEGRALPRIDIAKHVLAEAITENKSKIENKIVNKKKKTDEADLEKARRAVDINASGAIDIRAEDIYAMSSDAILEKYGTLSF